ncbi:hypothetical protein ACHWQZ_G019020 [Mnemiopsis leidyi]
MSDMLVPPINKKDVKELQDLFKEYDDDGSGELELEELKTMMKSLGVIARERDLKKLLHLIDDDLSGTIDCWELVKYIDTIMAEEFTCEELVEALVSTDSDVVSLEELRRKTKSTGYNCWCEFCENNRDLEFLNLFRQAIRRLVIRAMYRSVL